MIFINRSRCELFFTNAPSTCRHYSGEGCGTPLSNDVRASSISHKHFTIIGRPTKSISDALISFVASHTAYLIVVFCSKRRRTGLEAKHPPSNEMFFARHLQTGRNELKIGLLGDKVC